MALLAALLPCRKRRPDADGLPSSASSPSWKVQKGAYSEGEAKGGKPWGWCFSCGSACGAPAEKTKEETQDDRANAEVWRAPWPPAQLGGDGQYYCSTCWEQSWFMRGTKEEPLVSRLYARWPTNPSNAVEKCFPSTSSLCRSPGTPANADAPAGGGGGIDGAYAVRVGAVPSSGVAADAVRIFFEYGFVILRGAISAQAADEVLRLCREIDRGAREWDPEGLGNRGRGRYSFHNVVSPGQCCHFTAYARHLMDCPPVIDVLDAIYAEAGRRVSGPGPEGTAGDAEPEASERSAMPYEIIGAGGDFCEGWVREFQPLHSDYGRGRPLRGPPSWATGDFPIHDRQMPPMISCNYVVQPLNRWNGATRLIPWGEMDTYMTERYGDYQLANRDEDVEAGLSAEDAADLPGHMVKDRQTYRYDKRDKEVPPQLVPESKYRPEWLASRCFPMAPGDVLLRDVRVWHGGCPNLSRAARFLPSVEVASAELIHHFREHDNPPWPKQALPKSLAMGMSARTQRLCKRITIEDESDPICQSIDDVSWMKWKIGMPAKRNHFAPGLHLTPEQCDAISLQACLEQLAGEVTPLTDDQRQWLQGHLRTALGASCSDGAPPDVCHKRSLPTLASELLAALAGTSLVLTADQKDDAPPPLPTSAAARSLAASMCEQLSSLQSPCAKPGSAQAGKADAAP